MTGKTDSEHEAKKIISMVEAEYASTFSKEHGVRRLDKIKYVVEALKRSEQRGREDRYDEETLSKIRKEEKKAGLLKAAEIAEKHTKPLFFTKQDVLDMDMIVKVRKIKAKEIAKAIREEAND